MLYVPLSWDPKDPDEVLDYSIDWSLRLGTDALVSSVWAIEEGDDVLVLGSHQMTDKQTTTWMSGGTDGTRYVIRNRVMTALGRTIDTRVVIYCFEH